MRLLPREKLWAMNELKETILELIERIERSHEKELAYRIIELEPPERSRKILTAIINSEKWIATARHQLSTLLKNKQIITEGKISSFLKPYLGIEPCCSILAAQIIKLININKQFVVIEYPIPAVLENSVKKKWSEMFYKEIESKWLFSINSLIKELTECKEILIIPEYLRALSAVLMEEEIYYLTYPPYTGLIDYINIFYFTENSLYQLYNQAYNIIKQSSKEDKMETDFIENIFKKIFAGNSVQIEEGLIETAIFIFLYLNKIGSIDLDKIRYKFKNSDPN